MFAWSFNGIPFGALVPHRTAAPTPTSIRADEYCATPEQKTWLASLRDFDIFSNSGAYQPRVECLQTASGSPDWFWIVALIVLTLGVMAWYIKIFHFWRRCYYAEDERDRNGKMMQLAQIFLWCAICGYGMSVLMFFWPAYRLLAVFLLILNIWSWRFIATIGDFRISLSAKRLERELHESLQSRAAELEELVQRRTAELQQARSEADAANEAKNRFLANMSHEIRTPLTAILGFADLADAPDATPEHRIDALATIRRNGHHLLQVINDILDLAKVESGELKLEQTPCSPRAIVDDAAQLYRARANAKGIAIEVHVDQQVPDTITSDPTRLRQVLFNFLNNAVKFTERGTITIEATADSDTVSFAVMDSGIGMSATQLDRIFEPFAQADDSTTRRFGGTGLGLSIARLLSEKMGGTVEAVSAIGEGSVFTLRIPREAASGTPAVPHIADRTGPKPTKPTSRTTSLTGRALLVEDGPDNQRLIAHVLRRAGLTVELADNGRIGTDKVFEAQRMGNPYDIILMDMQMPEMDGYEATRLLRKQGCTLPVVALTANAMAADRDKCLAAGCTDYATKPLNVPALLELLARVMQQHKSHRDAA